MEARRVSPFHPQVQEAQDAVPDDVIMPDRGERIVKPVLFPSIKFTGQASESTKEVSSNFSQRCELANAR
jgi:hypothetical protein